MADLAAETRNPKIKLLSIQSPVFTGLWIFFISFTGFGTHFANKHLEQWQRHCLKLYE
jgi:hypothetical protein